MWTPSLVLIILAALMARPAMSQTSVEAETDDTFLATTVADRPNMEPAMDRPEQVESGRQRLAALRKQLGQPPNIVVILLDDVGYGDLGAYGGGSTVGAATPNMDELAAGGIRFTHAYSQPSCTPTRATIMTGQLPIRTGLIRPMLPGEGTSARGLDPKTTLPAKLRQAGYVTEAIGKWHLGEFKEAQPQNVGFDHYFGILTSSDDYTAWREQWRNPDLIHDPARRKWAAEGEVMAIVEGATGEEAKPAFEITNDTIRFVDEQLTNAAIEFIESRAKDVQPFFLYFATRGAHNDSYPHPDFLGKSLAKYPFKDVMVELDYRVGQIREALADAGKLENTIIFLASDNGPFMETFPDRGVTPFRGGKGSSYEGGVRVPTIVFWDGVIAPGQVKTGLFDLIDVYATALSLAGASDAVPSDRYIDSIDQASYLLGENARSMRRAEYYWASDTFMGLRVAEFKLLVKEQQYEHTDTWPAISPFQGMVSKALYGGKLFNLLLDTQERHAMLPLKQPQVPVLFQTMNRHLATFKTYPAAVPFE